MTWTALIGAVAAWLGTAACLPPTWRVFRRRSARDYSWLGLAMSLVCMTLMLTYLAALQNWLALAGQALCFLAACVIAVVKRRTERRLGQGVGARDPWADLLARAATVPAGLSVDDTVRWIVEHSGTRITFPPDFDPGELTHG
jgi:uncharacterized protein with PQ loop repeat